MKKIILICIAFVATSCYRNSVYVGDMQVDEPKIEVITLWNDQYFWGSFGGGVDHKTKDFAEKYPNFMVETKIGALNYLVSFVTFGIYTPTTTTYYIPVNN